MDALKDFFDPDEGPPTWLTAVLFAAVLLGGAALRLPQALDASVYLWDDAVVHLEALYVEDWGAAVGEGLRLHRQEARTGEDVFRFEERAAALGESTDGVPLSFARPLHDVAVLTGQALLGASSPRRSSAAALSSAIAGTLALVLAFFVGRRMQGDGGGLIAMVALAVDGNHVLYSRQGFVEAHLSLWLLAVVLVMLGARRRMDKGEEPIRGTFLLGLFLGIGVLFHFRFVVFAAIVIGAEILTSLQSRKVSPPVSVARIALTLSGLALPLLLAEAPFYAQLLAARSRGVLLGMKTYVEQIVWVLAPQGLGYAGSLVRFDPSNLGTYPLGHLITSGVVVSALGLVGIVDVLRPRRRTRGIVLRSSYRPYGERTLVALVVLPLLLYTVTVPLLRFGAVCFALVPLLATRMICGLGRRGSSEGVLLAVGLSVALILGGLLWTTLPYLRPPTRSGYLASLEQMRHVAELDEDEPLPPVVATMAPVYQVLLGRDRVAPVPASLAELEEAHAQGHRFLVVDSLVDFLAHDGRGFPERQALLRSVEERCEAVARVPNDAGASLVHDLELNHQPLTVTWRRHREAEERQAAFIRIYDLETCTAWRTASKAP